jgi:F-type H+-transporting ATPase subunit b
MNAFFLLAETSGGGPLEVIGRTFGVDWPHLTAQIISFCIVCALLYRFSYRPVLAMLEERRKRIAEGLANAEKIKTELAQTEGDRQKIMQQVGAEATKLVEEARAAAARFQQEETRKASAAAQQMMLSASEAAKREHDRMLAELRREVGRLVVETTAAVVGKVLTPEDQRRLAEEAARQLTS